ncbi:unnamed protein product [[Candida] boidinii]|uniref:Unnamed protein product n=1 Tax=Candida boidinii TaxID=5477 RepID=A0A9W6W9M0_CANBO|nr:hypothetical protein BVG19_g882 [[Candida] boidinii]OWB48721.1 hypothetical protein B5S27_g256 [[Candida] boidinii]OWB68916.1 hypothetical protein B5S30_g4309 [[Candida] boidinii]OWB84766.1 hypothetical protein B5S33_g3418 [[Candida] boidinii]GME69954.1 unnamed protein product [[Candida] boidinii]
MSSDSEIQKTKISNNDLNNKRQISVITSTFNYIKQEPTVSLLCGGIAGALSRTVVSPVERVKVLYQVQGSTQGYNKGTIHSIIQIWKEEGWKGMFRGNGINCIRIIPYSAVQYSVYQDLKKYLLAENETELSIVNKLVAGSIAGFASVLVTYPMDLVKTRLSIQTAKSLKNLHHSNNTNIKTSPPSPSSSSKIIITEKISKPPGMFKSIKDIYLYEGGIRGLYRGLLPTSIGVAPYVALNFAFYEKLKEQFPIDLQSNLIIKLTIGAVSGGIAQTLCYPFDILRRRFQVATLDNGSMGFKYNSTMDALTKIVKYEGYKGLYKGWTANMWKIMPSMAVQWASYDLLRDFITNH